MKKLLLFIILTISVLSCGIDAPEPNVYEAFRCVEYPEERLYFPEEKLVFKFNMPINPNSLSGFSVSSENMGNLDSIDVSEDLLTILPPLPAEDKIFITMSSALKSADNKPLQTNGGFTENKEKTELLYETGKKLPDVAEIFPDDSKSSTVAVRFDSEVDIRFSNVEPKPADMMKVDEWYIFIYEKPVEKISIASAKALEREAELENIAVVLPAEEPAESEISFADSVTDTAFSLSVKGDSVVAMALKGRQFICPKGCTAVLDDLEPEKKYELHADIYTKTGKKSEIFSFRTEEASPHIMISEIMHTPILEPQKSWEFVEIYNYSEMDFDLSGCMIDDKDDGKGIDPLAAKNADDKLILKSGGVAVITGNEASFADILPSGALWLIVDDTTIADGGLTGTESVQIYCDRDGAKVLEAEADPSVFKTEKGFSFTMDAKGRKCQSEAENGTPGVYSECR